MILRKIKQLLGMGSSDSTKRSETDVVMQQESSEPDTETESAVKGVDESGDTEAGDDTESDVAEDDAEVEDADDDAEAEDTEAVAAATDADASTESLVDEEETQEHAESRAEPAEAAGPGAEDETTDIEEAEPDTDAPDVEDTVEDATAEEPDLEEDDGTPVDTIKGIGPAYSERLGEVGIDTVAELADADPEELAERITVAEKTVAKWVDRAKEHAN